MGPYCPVNQCKFNSVGVICSRGGNYFFGFRITRRSGPAAALKWNDNCIGSFRTAYSQASTIRHGFNGVPDKMEKCLPDLFFIQQQAGSVPLKVENIFYTLFLHWCVKCQHALADKGEECIPFKGEFLFFHRTEKIFKCWLNFCCFFADNIEEFENVGIRCFPLQQSGCSTNRS